MVGQANSGKDTIAKMIADATTWKLSLPTMPSADISGGRGVSVLAFADPIKRLAKFIFDFEDDCLWGPSHTRNTVIDRFQNEKAWDMSYGKILLLEKLSKEKFSQLPDVLPENCFVQLKEWFRSFKEAAFSSTITPRLTLQSLGTEFGRAYDKEIWTNLAIKNSISLLTGGYFYTSNKGLRSFNGASDLVVISDGRFRNEILAVKSAGGIVVKVECPQATSSMNHPSEVEQKNIPKHFFDFTITNDKSKGFQALREDVEVLLKKVF